MSEKVLLLVLVVLLGGVGFIMFHSKIVDNYNQNKVEVPIEDSVVYLLENK